MFRCHVSFRECINCFFGRGISFQTWGLTHGVHVRFRGVHSFLDGIPASILTTLYLEMLLCVLCQNFLKGLRPSRKPPTFSPFQGATSDRRGWFDFSPEANEGFL